MDIDHINIKQCAILCKCSETCFYGWVRSGKMVKAINYRSSKRTIKFWDKQVVLDKFAAIEEDKRISADKHVIPPKVDIVGDYNLVNQVLNRSIT